MDEPDGVCVESAEKIRIYLNNDKIPLVLMGVEVCEIPGVVQWKYREMDIYRAGCAEMDISNPDVIGV